MTFLSNGIYRPRGEDVKNLSELPLEAFVFPIKKDKKRELLKKPDKESDSGETGENGTGDNSGPEKAGKDLKMKSLISDEAETPQTLLQVEEKKKAEIIIKEAQSKARKLLDRAEREAEALREKASQQGYTEGWDKGFKEGQEKAQEESEKERELQNQQFHDSLSQALSSVEKEKEACLKKYLEELKNLAISVGEKVIRISLKSNGDVIRRMIEGETEKLKKMAWVRIYMEHSDYETMLQADEEVLTHLARLSDNVKFVVMEDGTGGSCIIEMPDEIIDMSIDTQMENIRKLLGNVCF